MCLFTFFFMKINNERINEIHQDALNALDLYINIPQDTSICY